MQNNSIKGGRFVNRVNRSLILPVNRFEALAQEGRVIEIRDDDADERRKNFI